MRPMEFASTFGGVEVIVDDSLGRRREQVRFPRSRRKRMRKKWRRNAANWRTVYDGPQALHVKKHRGVFGWNGPMLIVNPPAKALLDRELSTNVVDHVERKTAVLLGADPLRESANAYTVNNTYAASRGEPRLHSTCAALTLLENIQKWRRVIMDCTP